jgi:hypothetical protein
MSCFHVKVVKSGRFHQKPGSYILRNQKYDQLWHQGYTVAERSPIGGVTVNPTTMKCFFDSYGITFADGKSFPARNALPEQGSHRHNRKYGWYRWE